VPVVIVDRVTHSPEETVDLGRELAGIFQPPCLVLLEGELGAGKTTLVKGVAEGLGAAHTDDVTSPTFTLVHEYGQARKVYHVDLYRMEGERDIASLGLEDALSQNSTMLVEWGERLGDNASTAQFKILLEHCGHDERHIQVVRLGA
jgi:tRNA threonylcarbamoyladenosine biosynthesis protein TsaE